MFRIINGRERASLLGAHMATAVLPFFLPNYFLQGKRRIPAEIEREKKSKWTKSRAEGERGQKSISDINIGHGFLADDSQPHLNIFAH